MILPDGTVIESNLSATMAPSAAGAWYSANSLLVGQIVNIIPIDDRRSMSKQFVEYDVEVYEYSTAVIYGNVRPADTYGTVNNFQEEVLFANLNSNSQATILPDHRLGSMVLIACIDGQQDKAVILKCIQHAGMYLNAQQGTAPGTFVGPVPAFQGNGGTTPVRDQGMQNLPTLLPGAVAADGNRILGEYQGFRWNINAQGEATFMAQGPKNTDGALTNSAMGTLTKYDSSGRFIILDSSNNSLVVDPTAGITLSNGQPIPTTLTLAADGTAIILALDPTNLAAQIQLGSSSASDPILLGQETIIWLTSLTAALQAMAAALLPPGLPVPAKGALIGALTALQIQLSTPGLLSQHVFTDPLGP